MKMEDLIISSLLVAVVVLLCVCVRVDKFYCFSCSRKLSLVKFMT